MFANLFALLSNDDLKTKRYIFMALNKLISIQDYNNDEISELLDISCALR